MGGLKDLFKGAVSPLNAVATGLGLAVNAWKFGKAKKMYKEGTKSFDKLMANQPVYKRPEEYAQELAMRKRLAASEMPGLGYRESRIGQATSEALSASEKGAISSNVYQQSVGDILKQRLGAEQALGYESSLYKQQMDEAKIGTMQRGAGYSDQEFQFNKLQPWEMGIKDAMSQKGFGAQGMFSGAEGFAGNVMDFAGTQYMNKILGAQMNMGSAAQGAAKSQPIGNPYNPNNNLFNTASKKLPWGKGYSDPYLARYNGQEPL